MSSFESLKAFAHTLDAEVMENEPMSRHTTFRIGGPADLFLVPRDLNVLSQLCAFCRREGIPFFALGNGSNLLVSDKGIRGAVVLTSKIAGIKIDGETLVCGAGASLRSVCEAARDAGLTGLEFAFGIPGTVGGAVYMNAGAYGGEMKDAVASVSYIDGAETGELSGAALCFGYRSSAFSGTGKLITQVTFSLKKGDKAAIEEKMCDLMERRRTKQPLEWPSAGSVFKRPEGNFAGTLIENCGLKGTSIGGAMVSEKHAGFIINAGGATCGDVLGLIEKIKAEVLRKTGILLEQEIRVAGDS